MQLDDYINFNTFFLILSGLANVYLFWKRGGHSATKDLMDIQEKQIVALKTDVELGRSRGHDLANHLQGLSLKVGVLEGQTIEKDKKLEEYLSIIQNRNPELETVLKSIETFMHLINDKLDLSQKRDTAIDKSTSKGEGNLMRRGKTNRK